MMRASIVTATLFCCGCAATFAEYHPPQLSITGTPRALAATIATEAYLVAGATLLRTPGYFGVAGAAEQGLRESGLFSAVSTDPGVGDLEGLVTVRMFQTEMHSGIITLITGFLFPGTIDFRVDVSVALYDPRSNHRVTAERSSAFRAWYQLFLLPLMFTHSPGGFQLELARGLTTEAAAAALDDIAQTAA